MCCMFGVPGVSGVVCVACVVCVCVWSVCVCVWCSGCRVSVLRDVFWVVLSGFVWFSYVVCGVVCGVACVLSVVYMV